MQLYYLKMKKCSILVWKKVCSGASAQFNSMKCNKIPILNLIELSLGSKAFRDLKNRLWVSNCIFFLNIIFAGSHGFINEHLDSHTHSHNVRVPLRQLETKTCTNHNPQVFYQIIHKSGLPKFTNHSTCSSHWLDIRFQVWKSSTFLPFCHEYINSGQTWISDFFCAPHYPTVSNDWERREGTTPCNFLASCALMASNILNIDGAKL